MISPVASHKRLLRTAIGENLEAYRCPETSGLYIPAQSYWRWLQSQPGRLAHLPISGDPPPSSEHDTAAKLCPESGTLMTAYRVGHGFTFRIDRSATGGIWLDAGEWDQLKARNFHDEIHLVFTAPWQRAELLQHQAAALEQTYRTKLGHHLFERLTTLRLELATHPHRQAALAYLTR